MIYVQSLRAKHQTLFHDIPACRSSWTSVNARPRCGKLLFLAGETCSRQSSRFWWKACWFFLRFVFWRWWADWFIWWMDWFIINWFLLTFIHWLIDWLIDGWKDGWMDSLIDIDWYWLILIFRFWCRWTCSCFLFRNHEPGASTYLASGACQCWELYQPWSLWSIWSSCENLWRQWPTHWCDRRVSRKLCPHQNGLWRWPPQVKAKLNKCGKVPKCS